MIASAAMKLPTTSLVSALALLLAAGCGMVTTSTGNGAAPKGGSGALAGTMADAQTFKRGASITSPLACNAAGYAKIDVPQGEAYKIELTVSGPAGACVHVRHLKGSGGDGGVSTEFCSDKEPSKTFDVTGQEGGNFLEVMENPPCKGAGLKIDIH